MGTNSLTPTHANGAVIDHSDVDDLAAALDGDFVGRSTIGVPTSGQNLGTPIVPWGTVYAAALSLNGNSVQALTVPGSRVISGKIMTAATIYANTPAYITANGAAATANLLATATPLALSIAGNPCTISADDTFTSLTLGPAATNTCLINNTALSGQNMTVLYGEKAVTIGSVRHPQGMQVDTMGASISAKVGTWQYFKLVHGANTEIFYAFITSTTFLTGVKRGVVDTTGSNYTRGLVSDNDVITMLQGNWLFIQYSSPTTYTKDFAVKQPWQRSYIPEGAGGLTTEKTPGTGDYSFDNSTNSWYEWSGSAWVARQAVYIGVAICDSAACKWVIPAPFYQNHGTENDIMLSDTGSGIMSDQGAACVVNGTRVTSADSRFLFTPNSFLTDAVLAVGAGTTNLGVIYCYLTDLGSCLTSYTPPRETDERGGMYHPIYNFRCVGYSTMDAAHDPAFIAPGPSSFSNTRRPRQEELFLTASPGYGSTNTKIRRYTTARTQAGAAIGYADSVTLGATFTINEPGMYAIVKVDRHNAANNDDGISLNSNQLTTGVGSITIGNVAFYMIGSIDRSLVQQVTLFLQQGDIIRSHVGGAQNTYADDVNVNFRITKVG